MEDVKDSKGTFAVLAAAFLPFCSSNTKKYLRKLILTFVSVYLPQQGHLFQLLSPPSSGFRNKVSTLQILKCVWEAWEKKKRKKPWLASVCVVMTKDSSKYCCWGCQPWIHFTLLKMRCWNSSSPLGPQGCGLTLQQTRHGRAWAAESRSLMTSWPLHTSPEQPAFWLFSLSLLLLVPPHGMKDLRSPTCSGSAKS